MGKPDQSKSSKTLAVTVGANGAIKYDAIVKQGRNKDKHIASTHDAMVPKLDKLKDVSMYIPHLSIISKALHHSGRGCALHLISCS